MFVAESVWVIDIRKGFTPTSLFDQVSKLKCGSCTLVQYHSIHVHPPLRLRLCPNHKIFFYLWPRTTVYMQVRTLLTMNVTLWPFQILETIHIHIHNLYWFTLAPVLDYCCLCLETGTWIQCQHRFTLNDTVHRSGIQQVKYRVVYYDHWKHQGIQNSLKEWVDANCLCSIHTSVSAESS